MTCTFHSRFIDGLVHVRDEYWDGWKRKHTERLLPMATKWNESPKTSPESNPKMSKNWDCEWVAVNSEHFEYNIFIWKKSFYMEYSGHMTFMWNETRLHFDLYGWQRVAPACLATSTDLLRTLSLVTLKYHGDLNLYAIT